MANFDEGAGAARDDEELRPSPGEWNRPLLLAGLGLVLMLGGYAATSYVPVTPRQAEQEQRLAELRQQATQRQADGVEDALPERLNQVTPPWRNPPYQMAGRLAIYGGLVLFVMAGVLMYRSSPPPTKDIDEKE
jgi:type VI protein secretion system component VasK